MDHKESPYFRHIRDFKIYVFNGIIWKLFKHYLPLTGFKIII